MEGPRRRGASKPADVKKEETLRSLRNRTIVKTELSEEPQQTILPATGVSLVASTAVELELPQSTMSTDPEAHRDREAAQSATTDLEEELPSVEDQATVKMDFDEEPQQTIAPLTVESPTTVDHKDTEGNDLCSMVLSALEGPHTLDLAQSVESDEEEEGVGSDWFVPQSPDYEDEEEGLQNWDVVQPTEGGDEGGGHYTLDAVLSDESDEEGGNKWLATRLAERDCDDDEEGKGGWDAAEGAESDDENGLSDAEDRTIIKTDLDEEPQPIMTERAVPTIDMEEKPPRPAAVAASNAAPIGMDMDQKLPRPRAPAPVETIELAEHEEPGRCTTGEADMNGQRDSDRTFASATAAGVRVSEKRIDAALRTGAFRIDPNNSKSDPLPREEVRQALEAWDRAQAGMKIKEARLTNGWLKRINPNNKFNITGIRAANFDRISSTDTHWQMVDKWDTVIAYRYRLNDPNGTLLQNLKTSAAPLPRTPTYANDVGIRYSVRSYATWIAPKASEPALSADFHGDIPQSTNFMHANQPLFQQLSMDFRNICPVQYAKYTCVHRWLPQGTRVPAEAWLGASVYFGQHDVVGGAEAHQYWKD